MLVSMVGSAGDGLVDPSARREERVSGNVVVVNLDEEFFYEERGSSSVWRRPGVCLGEGGDGAEVKGVSACGGG